jgi:4-oxalocrotonate tautomerase
LRPVTWVKIDEVKEGNWGIGGNCLTAADVHRMQMTSV